jgi:tryptophanyl-tRNA synthetase
MTRDIAQKFNDRFGAVFRLPEPVIREAVAAVPGLDGQKMSKSYGNTLELFGDPKVLQKKVMSLKTDSTPVEAPKPVEGSILADLYRLVAPEKFETFAQSLQAGGRGYGDYKKDLVAELENFLAPMRARQAEWAKEPGAVEEVLAQGAVRARALAEPTIQKAREAVGLK